MSKLLVARLRLGFKAGSLRTCRFSKPGSVAFHQFSELPPYLISLSL